MVDMKLTKSQARRFLLAHHALLPPNRLVGKEGVLLYIRKAGCIQYDPLNIVGRNPDLVLQSRIRDYTPELLKELLYEDRLLVDGWDKNMSIYPLEDWPNFSRRREEARKYYGDPGKPANAVIPHVRDEIEKRGPLSSLDLDLDEKVDWSWSPTKIGRAALESMYNWGELIIHHKVNTRKVYDFSKRHLPVGILDARDPNTVDEAFHDWYLMRRIGGVGLIWNKASNAWLGMLGMKSGERNGAFKRLLKRKDIVEVIVEGVDEPLYMRDEDRAILELVLEGKTDNRNAAILAPLDNLLWDRRLIEALFNFYYVWEVYKPAAERQFGYYVLPILYGDRFVARFDPARDKKNGALIVNNWWWEPGTKQSTTMHKQIRTCFKKFMKYLGTDEIVVGQDTLDRESLDWLVIE